MFGDEAATAQSADDTGPDFYVFEQNWDAVKLFSALQTQWIRGVGMGGVITFGLDYQAMISVMPLVLGDDVDKQDVFARLQVMEHEALGILNKS